MPRFILFASVVLSFLPQTTSAMIKIPPAENSYLAGGGYDPSGDTIKAKFGCMAATSP